MYYYRVNYAIIILAVLTCVFIRNLSALAAIATCTLGLLCLNDTFAASARYACAVAPVAGIPAGMNMASKGKPNFLKEFWNMQPREDV